MSTPAQAGACDDNSALKPGINDSLSWPTVDNPGNKAALAYASLFFSGLIGVVVAAVGAIHFLVWFSTRQLRKRSA